MNIPAQLEPFIAHLQETALRPTWSQGLELSRSKSVLRDPSPSGRETEEFRFRVMIPGKIASPRVTLWLDDEDWHCSCGDRGDLCAHVIAAALAWRAGRVQLPDSDIASTAHRVQYVLRSSGSTLTLLRLLLPQRTPLKGSLVEYIGGVQSGRIAAPMPATSPIDFQLEGLLPAPYSGSLPAATLSKVLGLLRDIGGVQLDDQPVQIESSPLRWSLTLSKPQSQRVRLEARLDSGIDGALESARFFQNGAVLVGGKLFALAPIPKLEGVSWPESLAVEWDESRFRELASVYAQDWPELDWNTIARPINAEPVIEFIREESGEVTSESERRLRVLAQLNYPSLQLGEYPIRDRTLERQLWLRLQSELHLRPGQWAEFKGREAFEFEGRLARWTATPILSSPMAKSVSSGAFDLEISSPPEGATGWDPIFTAQGQSFSAQQVLQAWRANEQGFYIPGVGLAKLPMLWLGRFGEDLQALLDASQKDPQSIAAKNAACSFWSQVESTLPAPVPLPTLNQLRAEFDRKQREVVATGKTCVQAELRPYQREGILWLEFWKEQGFSPLLADDMGLGKTLQALAVVEPGTLVLCPASVVSSWEAQAKKFRPDLSVQVYWGSDRSLPAELGLVVTSYGTFRRDLERLSETTWKCLVLDEAQMLKNADTHQWNAVQALPRKWTLALSGTPVENRATDLWSLFELLNPGLLGRREQFSARISELKAVYTPLILRRTKNQVAKDLPPKTETVQYVELSDTDAKIYSGHLARAQSQIKSGGAMVSVLEALLRLRQACVSDDKLEAAVAQIRELIDEGHKILVFSQWTTVLDRLEAKIGSASEFLSEGAAAIPHLRLDGATVNRGAIIEQFQDPDGPKLLVMSLKAGGVGITLTEADHVILLDPWWNPFVEDQAIDRTHRIGQVRPVMVTRWIVRDSIEERILELQAKKRDLVQLLEGEALLSSQSGGITQAELEGLLE